MKKTLKWFFALSEATLARPDHDWENLALTAAKSAILNTSLKPNFIYDGNENSLTRKLRELGVNIISHRVTFYDSLSLFRQEDPYYLPIASGAFLRTEIPVIEKSEKFVLYTDLDVIFLTQPDFSNLEPNYFACAPERNPSDTADMNSGVMLMNLESLRSDIGEFTSFIRENLNIGLDQELYRTFYKGRFDTLPLEYNWKPYWGVNEKADIIHFHGPKPVLVEKLLNNPLYETAPIFKEIFDENPESYKYYLKVWQRLSS